MSAWVMILDDEIKMGKALRHVLVKEGYEVEAVADPREALSILEKRPFQVLLCDLKMPGLSGLDVLERARGLQPDLNVIMMTAYASAETAVESMKKGAYDYLIKPFSTDELKILIARCLSTRALEEENRLLREQVRENFRPDGIVARGKTMQAVLNRARKVAESNATVLITGESGTGKEMLARAVHEASPRADKAFVTVNCGALTESILESELFGHRRGAFTGAVENRAGVFEAADGGTIFLDEIGEVSQAVQVKLLRVLQSGEVQRVGDASRAIVDVRVIAATNKNLEKMVEDGSFRTDLYYRLNVVPLYIPPLRERREDIAPLIEHFLGRYGKGGNYRFSREAFECMQTYGWPGNVRELENAVEHAVVLAETKDLDMDSLPIALRNHAGETSDTLDISALEGMTLDETERRLIMAAMDRTEGNMTRAARQLGITRRALGYRLRKHGLYEGRTDDEADEESDDSREDELWAEEGRE